MEKHTNKLSQIIHFIEFMNDWKVMGKNHEKSISLVVQEISYA